MLEGDFGEARLREALTGVIVPAYDIERRQPVFFRSQMAVAELQAHDLRNAGCGTRPISAAPTYFEPFRLRTGGSMADYTWKGEESRVPAHLGGGPA